MPASRKAAATLCRCESFRDGFIVFQDGYELAQLAAFVAELRTELQRLAPRAKVSHWLWAAIGAILLSRKQIVMVPAGGADDAPSPPQSKKAAKAAQQQAGVDAVKESVNANLDSLKEDVFRLELRKQAGTISEEDYAREKSRVEKLLRDLVRG